MSRRRSGLVSGDVLAQLADELQLQSHILVLFPVLWPRVLEQLEFLTLFLVLGLFFAPIAHELAVDVALHSYVVIVVQDFCRQRQKVELLYCFWNSFHTFEGVKY